MTSKNAIHIQPPQRTINHLIWSPMSTAFTDHAKLEKFSQLAICLITLVGVAKLGQYLVLTAPQLWPVIGYFLLSALSGLSLAAWWAPLLKPQSLVEHLGWSLITGLIIPPLLILVVGWAGAPINVPVVAACYLVLGLCGLVGKKKETIDHFQSAIESFKAFRIIPKGMWWEFGLYALFMGFTIFMCIKHFFPSWDNFTFWLLEAKVIFETGYLIRDSNVQDLFYRSSFYPLHAVIMYLLAGRLVEQYASLITAAYFGASMFLCLLAIRQSSLPVRIFSLGALSAAVTVFSVQGLPFNSYGDVTSAFYVTLFVYLLLFVSPSSPSLFPRRMSMMSMVLTLLLLMKDEHSYYVYILMVAWIMHDVWTFRGSSIQALILRNGIREFSVLIGCTSLIFATKLVYNRFVHPIPNSPFTGDLVTVTKYVALSELTVIYAPICLMLFAILSKRLTISMMTSWLLWIIGSVVVGALAIKIVVTTVGSLQLSNAYNSVLFQYLYDNNQTICWLTLGLYVVSTLGIVFKRQVSLKGVLSLALIPLLVSLPIFNYIIYQSSLTSNSLRRYITVVFFLIPFAAALTIGIQRKLGRFSMAIVGGLSLLTLAYPLRETWNMMSSYPLRRVPVHHGGYDDTWTQRGWIDTSNNVKKFIGDGTIAVCAIQEISGRCSNADIPGIYLRYYLSDKAVGGQIFGEDVFAVLSRTKANFLFVLNGSPQVSAYLGASGATPSASLFKVEYPIDSKPKLIEVAG